MMNTILGAANIMEFYDTNTMAKWELRENKKFKIRKNKKCAEQLLCLLTLNLSGITKINY